jgi:hypothetical protein
MEVSNRNPLTPMRKRKVNHALRDRLLNSWPTNPYATLPESVMPLTEEEFNKQFLEDLDLGDYEYDYFNS